MVTTKLSTKGQLIIPREIRNRLGWRPGMELLMENRGDCVVIRLLKEVPESTCEELAGCAEYDGPPRTLEEMDEAIARGARESR